jgi:hypothetical protein
MGASLDIERIAKELGAERRGKVSPHGGFFGALQLAAEVTARLALSLPSRGVTIHTELEPFGCTRKVNRENAMIDTTTFQPLSVSTDGGAWPYIMVPVAQLDKVSGLLDVNQIPYWVDEESISLDGKPEIAVINLRQGSKPQTVQKILDSIN